MKPTSPRGPLLSSPSGRPSHTESSSSRYFLSLAYPVIVIALLGMLIIGWNLMDSRDRQLTIVKELSEQAMMATLQEKQRNLNLVLNDYAYWDQTLNFITHRDADWARREIGQNLTEPFELAASILIDQNGKILWWQGAFLQSGLQKEVLEKALRRDHVMPRLMNSWQEVPAKARSAFFRLDKQVFSLHGVLVTSDEEGYQPAPSGRAALLLLKEIDQPVLTGLQRYKQSKDIRLELLSSGEGAVSAVREMKETPRSAVPLVNFQGVPVAQLTWMPVFEVMDVYGAIGPKVLIFLLVTGLCFFWYVHRVRAAAARLDDEILARKKAQTELARHKEQLELLVDERTQALYEALEKVQQASEEKTRFSSQMNHEMRTPLNAISGFSQLLQEELTSPEHQDYVAEILKASNRLTRIVDQALRLTALEDDTAQTSQGECDPFVILNGMTGRYREQAERRALQLLDWGLDRDVICAVPSDTVRDVFNTLLDNAMLYSNPDGLIEIKATCDNERIQIRVIDDGIGIPAEKETQLFQPFSRLHFDLLPNIEGVGLGLFMARKKLRACGADLDYKPGLNGGSCFTVTLPVADR